MAKILGIDPALTTSGWGVIEVGPKPIYLAHGIIKSNPKQTLAQRLCYIFLEIAEVIEEHVPDEMAIERTYINHNGFSSLLLATSRAAPLIAAALKDVPTFEYAPTHVKKAITGYGYSEKEHISKLLRFTMVDCPQELPTDASDALAVAVTHLMHKNTPS